MKDKLAILKKTSVATALAMAGPACWAQSSVTLYGIVDAGLLYTSKTLSPANGGNAGSQWALTDAGLAPSSFGITGREDLGGGLNASFDLESGYSTVTGGFNNSNGNLFGRQAWVALKGGWGELKAGLQYSPFFLALYETDARAFSQFGSGLVSYVNNVLATGIFNANSIAYSSPTVGGFHGSALFAFGGEAGELCRLSRRRDEPTAISQLHRYIFWLALLYAPYRSTFLSPQLKYLDLHKSDGTSIKVRYDEEY
jgi:predicted porin